VWRKVQLLAWGSISASAPQAVLRGNVKVTNPREQKTRGSTPNVHNAPVRVVNRTKLVAGNEPRTGSSTQPVVGEGKHKER